MSKYQHCYRVTKDKKLVIFTLKCNKGGIHDIVIAVGTDKEKANKYLKKAVGKAVDSANHYAKGLKFA